MMFSLIAEGMPIGTLVALIIVGVVVLALAIFGIVIKVREGRASNSVKRADKPAQTPAPKVEEKYYDFTHLTEEEKDLIRRHRDSK